MNQRNYISYRRYINWVLTILFVVLFAVWVDAKSQSLKELDNTLGFIRQENLGYATQTLGSYICGTDIKILQDWINRDEPEYANMYIVYLYPKDNKKWSLLSPDVVFLDRAIILAFDADKDGYYEYVIFDTDGDGKFDMELKYDPEEGAVKANEQGVLELYCAYQRLKVS